MGVGGQGHATGALPRKWTGTHCKKGWVGSRVSLDGCRKSRPYRGSILGPSSLRFAIPSKPSRPTTNAI